MTGMPTDRPRTYTTEEAEELLIAIREGIVCSVCVRADDPDSEVCPSCLASRDRGTGWPRFELYADAGGL